MGSNQLPVYTCAGTSSVTQLIDVNVLVRKALLAAVRLQGLDLWSARWRLYESGARYADVSGLISLDDAPNFTSERLWALIPTLIASARAQSLQLLRARDTPSWVHAWPGEHYRLLAALVEELQPRSVVDIGTYTGLSALTMLSAAKPCARIVTIDVIPWSQVPGTFLVPADFETGRLSQLLINLADESIARQYAWLLRDADLILVDAAKDGTFEPKLFTNFENVGLKTGALIVFDDIRQWNMLSFWRSIARSKLDLTSFGHFTGTGIVEWV
jgi:predicted O-methyltransferase YrrM